MFWVYQYVTVRSNVYIKITDCVKGSDPARYELLQKVKAQQKRILEQADTIVQLEDKCAEIERRHAHLEQTLSRSVVP